MTAVFFQFPVDLHKDRAARGAVLFRRNVLYCCLPDRPRPVSPVCRERGPSVRQSRENGGSRKWLRRLPALMILAVLAPLGIFWLGFRVYYNEFYSAAVADVHIPGLAENFVPQGLEACGGGEFLISGYISTTGVSRLYYIKANSAARLIRVVDRDGKPLVSHSGGICTNGPFTYLAGSGGNCYVLPSADIFDSASYEANVLGVLKTDNAASFCYLTEDHLLVGEYEYGRFKTEESHHITTPAGDRNTAVLLSYPLNGEAEFGVEPEPDRAYSIPERIQGTCVTGDGRIVLSASSFRNSSQLFFYDRKTVVQSPHGIYWNDGTPIPIYYLDTASCVDVLHLPPYSEETVYDGGQLYVLFESAANRFQFGKLMGGQYLYRMRLPEWERDAGVDAP